MFACFTDEVQLCRNGSVNGIKDIVKNLNDAKLDPNTGARLPPPPPHYPIAIDPLPSEILLSAVVWFFAVIVCGVKCTDS